MFGLYFHFPFCIKKCNYCSFYSKPEKNIDFIYWDSFFQKKLDLYLDLKPTSIYFGGGTPSLMPIKMVENILKRFNLNNVEITLEVNPETIDKEKMQDLKSIGINRLSIGVQALNDDVLKFMGRIHTVKKAVKTIEEAKSIFDKVTIDLIYGRPNQILSEWKKELNAALDFNLKHFSLYQLSVENGWQVELPGEETLADFYVLTTEIMESRGIKRYEVSNYAKDTENESRHNLTYWLGEDYLGVGPKAHSRYKSYEIINDKNGNIKTKHKLTKQERDTEIFLTSLRTKYGVKKELLYLTTKDKLQTMQSNGFIISDDFGIKATNKGYLLLDSVLSFLLI